MATAMRFGSNYNYRDNDHNDLSKVIVTIMILIIRMYSLSDLGFSSNLFGLLSKESIMRDPNKTKWPA